MPTKHKRIAVVADPDLSAALSAASADFPGRSAAATLRELALIGAEALKSSRTETQLDRIRAIPGVAPARASMSDYLKNRDALDPVDPEDPNALSRVLEEQREESL
jgi:hypothetical protein